MSSCLEHYSRTWEIWVSPLLYLRQLKPIPSTSLLSEECPDHQVGLGWDILHSQECKSYGPKRKASKREPKEQPKQWGILSFGLCSQNSLKSH